MKEEIVLESLKIFLGLVRVELRLNGVMYVKCVVCGLVYIRCFISVVFCCEIICGVVSFFLGSREVR